MMAETQSADGVTPARPLRTLRSVQFLRFVAAALVVVNHVFHTSQLYVDHASELAEYSFKIGAAGVHIFFVISGLVIVYVNLPNYTQTNAVGSYVKKRLVRIFPIYWAIAALNLIFLVFFNFSSVDYSIEDMQLLDYIRGFLLLPPNASSFIFVGWSLSYELYFYAVFIPFLLLRLDWAVPCLTVFLFGLAVIGAVSQPEDALVSVATNSLLLEFAFGAWIAWAAINDRLGPPWLSVALAALGIAGFVAGFMLGYERGPSALVWGLPSALLVFGMVGIERHHLAQGLFDRLSWLGDSSYALYLTHAVALPPISFILGTSISVPNVPTALPIFVVLGTFCVLLGLATHELVERPLTRAAGRLVGVGRRVPPGGVEGRI